jgi:hypothetical protein
LKKGTRNEAQPHFHQAFETPLVVTSGVGWPRSAGGVWQYDQYWVIGSTQCPFHSFSFEYIHE